MVRLLGVSFASLIMMSFAQGQSLDWDSVDWPSDKQWNDLSNATSVSHTFSNVSGSGVDLRLTIAGGPNIVNSGEENDLENWDTTPDDVNNRHTGANRALGTQQTLHTALRGDAQVDTDYGGNNPTGSDYLIFTIEFLLASTNTPVNVNNVEFQLWDMDLGGGTNFYQDQIIFDPSLVTPTFTRVGYFDGSTTHYDVEVFTDADGNDALRGIGTFNGTSSVTNNSGTANDSYSSGDVIVSYGAQSLNTIRFEYGSGSGARSLSAGGDIALPANPDIQRFGLYDISFVPEPSEYLAIGFALVTSILLLRRRV